MLVNSNYSWRYLIYQLILEDTYSIVSIHLPPLLFFELPFLFKFCQNMFPGGDGNLSSLPAPTRVWCHSTDLIFYQHICGRICDTSRGSNLLFAVLVLITSMPEVCVPVHLHVKVSVYHRKTYRNFLCLLDKHISSFCYGGQILDFTSFARNKL